MFVNVVLKMNFKKQLNKNGMMTLNWRELITVCILSVLVLSKKNETFSKKNVHGRIRFFLG